MADDVAALIRHLGLEKVDVMGYSLGGGTALFTPCKYPELVDRLVLVSVYLRPDAIDPVLLELQQQMGQLNADAAEVMKETPMYELYERVAPRPEDFGRLLDKLGEMMATPFDYTEEMRGLQVPTLLAAGDADQAPPAHYAEMFGCSAAVTMAAGWARTGRRAGTRWRSCPASSTTTSSRRRSWRPRPSRSSTRREPDRFDMQLRGT